VPSIPEKIVSGIPYFFYDLFGRIVPGVYLLGGTVFALRYHDSVRNLFHTAGDAHTAVWVAGYMLLVLASFAAGLLLGTCSRLFLHLPHIAPTTTLADLRDAFGCERTTVSPLEGAFMERFGFQLSNGGAKERNYLIYCSRLCHLAVAKGNSTLDGVIARVDSEEVFSRSFSVASLILLTLSWRWHEPHREMLWAYAALSIVSFFSYWHYNRKAMRERFQAFFVLTREAGRRRPEFE
jgi:hypothetical protein